ncbi:MAG: hypothetical protein CBC29_07315 [Methylococcaceae bacterium TMED69]|nr:MAG: hypothetical protein CBC29_05495 [Methylococcaceae bacterium TMED69]OUU74929.1 MAG: hypothetical protein CBC29_07315 [Methylococcaceae bacterium TMED69]|tara:strand:- start:1358 stop:1606 length:249 start_codon:yes stop_codon:yes gene_type:complete
MSEKIEKEFPGAEEAYNIYNLIMSMPETHLALGKLAPKAREEMEEYILGMSYELQKDVDNFKSNLTPESAQEIIKGLVEDVK